ncbi:hypothetical protein FUA24_19275 [Seonamhaeicola marinus]|uniref:Uncharacterized protein n=1 Tax=Seonamhaeicola marinus TaxID=1912246 RepID=A0A5D0HQP4_9FLAO|nr:hypothetical protein FUA24_19275 [Seonamhaeicola marinus]
MFLFFFIKKKLSYNLGKKINSKYVEFSPSISPDGKYLFFSRRSWIDKNMKEQESDIYWVSTEIFNIIKDSLSL